jgi:iron complex outermembrane receptor protein
MEFQRIIPPMLLVLSPLATAMAATTTTDTPETSTSSAVKTLPTVTVSADKSTSAVPASFAGGQVATGARTGILGNQKNLDTPFNTTSYTSDYIANQGDKSVGEVLERDPSVRVARGYGNFQESYFIRGFLLGSDDVSYNGLYGILPRQYVSPELADRVELLRGANSFLNGAAPSGGGIGGSVNLVGKQAPVKDVHKVAVGSGTAGQVNASADLSTRLGDEKQHGLRLNVARHQGGTGVDHERNDTDLINLAYDWEGERSRFSSSVGYQNHTLTDGRPSVTLGSGVTSVPDAPENSANWGQRWSYSKEKDVFGTVRGEYDLNDAWTTWATAGARRGHEENSLANVTVLNNSGDATTYRSDNVRIDNVQSAETGVRGKIETGPVNHEISLAASMYRLDSRNAYSWGNYASPLTTNLYDPTSYAAPATGVLTGGDMADPKRTSLNQFSSLAVADTLSWADDTYRLTLGARRQTLDIKSYSYSTQAMSAHYKESKLTPMAGFVYKWTPKVSLYTNYIESLAQGDTAGSTALNVGTQLPPYVSRQKEVGIKYEDDQFGGSVAYFSTKKPSGYLDTATQMFGRNGEDKHQGVEFTAYGQATRDVKVLGGLTLLNAKQEKTASGTYDGNRVIGVPKAMGNVNLEWQTPFVEGLFVDFNTVATGHSYADAANTLRVAGWTRYDLGARYLMDVGHDKVLTLRAAVDNLTDHNYWSSVGGYSGSGYLVEGAPRTFTLSASLDF